MIQVCSNFTNTLVHPLFFLEILSYFGISGVYFRGIFFWGIFLGDIWGIFGVYFGDIWGISGISWFQDLSVRFFWI